MEKKEKKSDLEQLLNSLIEKGWKPYDNKYYYGAKKNSNMQIGFLIKAEPKILNIPYTLRELVSKESGLWQFVCENGMIKTGRVFISWTKNANCDNYGDLFWDKACPKDFYEYRLIESALCDEDKLEDFILDNVKIGDI